MTLQKITPALYFACHQGAILGIGYSFAQAIENAMWFFAHKKWSEEKDDFSGASYIGNYER